MNFNVHTRNVDLLPSHNKLIQRHTAKIRKLLDSFSADAVDLTLRLERLPRGNQFRASLVLTLPQQTLAVESVQDAATSALTEVFRDLFRKIKRFKSHLSREQIWKRRRVGEQPSTPAAWEVQEIAVENLERLETFIRREILHAVMQGEIPPGVVEPQAVVDDVFLYVTSQPQAKPPQMTVLQWMIQTARELLQKRFQEAQEKGEDSHVEETAQEKTSWDDEVLSFYQPDEELRVEDLLADPHTDSPEEVLAREEMATRLEKAVAGLPNSLRESFVLFALEGFTSDEVAMMTGKTPDQVLAEVEEARELLRRELRA